ncbi:MAG: hypothetical protein GY796_36685 [Chloroflexi bacterium]|nr:hypothetical protein [Chloroflexota bacterium]
MSGDRIDLLFETILPDVRETHGRGHGKAVKYRGYKYVLFDPPILITPNNADVPNDAKPAPTPVKVQTTMPQRLVFGVHKADGRVRKNGLDPVAQKQLSMF